MAVSGNGFNSPSSKSGWKYVDLAGDKDSPFLFFKPLFETQVENSWTLYDLRALRDGFSKYGKINPELERVIFGYDFVVLIPDLKPSHVGSGAI